MNYHRSHKSVSKRFAWLTLPRLAKLFASCGAFAIICSASAFTVLKDVNNGKPLVEKLVIFEKGKPYEQIVIADPTANSDISFNKDGAIEVVIAGNKEINPTIHWKAGNGLPASFDAKNYTYLLVTCALIGDMKQTYNGKVSSLRPPNLWYGVSLLNKSDERAAGCSFADATEDGKTPAQMVTLKIPMVLFTQLASRDTSAISGFAFPWNKAHDNQNRDFHLIVEKIALAD